MPPAALISLTASFTPLLKLVPGVAPLPESSMMPAILTVDWADAVEAANAPAISSALRVELILNMSCVSVL